MGHMGISTPTPPRLSRSIEPYERMRRVGGLGCAITDADAERVDAIISTMAQAHSNSNWRLCCTTKTA